MDALPPNLPPVTSSPADRRTAEAAEAFEATFIASFLTEMMDQVRPRIAGGGAGEQMFSSLLSNEIAREIARSGGLGLGQSIAAQLDAYRR
ncbi:rod-binding protein [Tabrizicola sp.]|uniref:rod-binding protein n=1 Tax=Tabrizicola sp. TaxID=2005166 RepID=UPI0035B24C98